VLPAWLTTLQISKDRPASSEEAAPGWLLRGTGWIMLILIMVMGFWFFSYTTSAAHPSAMLALKATEDDTPIGNYALVDHKLSSLPSQISLRTGLSATVSWVQMAIPASRPARERVLHLPEKSVRKLEFVVLNLDRALLAQGEIGINISPRNAQKVFPGHAITLPSRLSDTDVIVLMRMETPGMTKVTGQLWDASEFSDAQSSAEQRTILLVGALMFLALYALAAASSGMVSHFLVFGVWLLARCGLIVMDSGFNYYAFSHLTSTDLGQQLMQFTYMMMPFATIMLVRTLFRDQLNGSVLAPIVPRIQQIIVIAMAVSIFLPFNIFQVVFWTSGAMALVTTFAVVAFSLNRATDMTTYWFVAALVYDTLGSGIGLLDNVGILELAGTSWFAREQAALIAAILTGMAVGTTLSKERVQRKTSQAEALGVLAKYEDVYRTVPIALVSIGVDGHIVRYNEGFGRMFGLKTSHVHYIAPEDRDQLPAGLDIAFPAKLRQRIREELTKSVQCDFDFRLDGHEIVQWVRVMARGEPDSFEASVTDITEQMQLQDQLSDAAERDALTGAWNRLGISHRLDEILQRSENIESTALCYIDLDRFKMLNDMFGHQAGDTVLIDVVKRLELALGESAIVSRLGGDEYLIVLPPADQAVHEGLAWRALEAITNEPFELGGKSFSVTASIGVFRLVKGMSQSELIAGADRSCQEAKRKGRNHVVVCADSDAMVRERYSELSLVSRLSDEKTFEDFELVAQPIVSMANPNDMGCEILLRYPTADGMRPAGPLIAAAEQNGEMASIDRWVLRHTLEWLETNHDLAEPLKFVSINLSGSSLNDEFFKTFVIAQLTKHRSNAKRVVLEITESVAMQDVFMMGKFIDAVRETGARIALDDFGSGYSNFASLTDVQASFLKIDGRFVNSLKENESATTIIKTINLLARELQMSCVAEWVEDIETLKLLRSIGTSWAQGYALSYPVPLDHLLENARNPRALYSNEVLALLDGPPVKNTSMDDILSATKAHTPQSEPV